MPVAKRRHFAASCYAASTKFANVEPLSVEIVDRDEEGTENAEGTEVAAAPTLALPLSYRAVVRVRRVGAISAMSMSNLRIL